ncbi:vesicle-trafficking protein SEC22 isoform X2 [Dermacentor variabilis]|uniref:vesicle-trafficking protein SEC22 isoform X2 n=1 Tax=Dermacentor variabilis TaxID=34621 RepID=UPI003F5C31BE
MLKYSVHHLPWACCNRQNFFCSYHVYGRLLKITFEKKNCSDSIETFVSAFVFTFTYLQNEFNSQYGSKVNSVNRPYSFIEFDTYIQKAKKAFMDSRARRNLSSLNSELQDVQRIMVQNIDDVLQRGSVISELDSKASNLSLLSQKYKKDARYLNLRSTYAKIAAVSVVIFVAFLYFYIF